MPYSEFLKLGISDVLRKFSSIPESEPLYTILKSRVINTSEIKNKDERKHWEKLKQANAIPKSYLSHKEIMINLKNFVKEKKI